MILICKGICAPVMHPRSGVPGLATPAKFFGSSQKTLRPTWCLKLVTGLLATYL